jgi:hypothetical protein
MHHKLSYLTIKKTLFLNAEVIVGGEEEEVLKKNRKRKSVLLLVVIWRSFEEAKAKKTKKGRVVVGG